VDDICLVDSNVFCYNVNGISKAEAEKMRSKIIFTMLGILLSTGGLAPATTIDFNSVNPVGTIQDGDNYDYITLHDSATVTMMGGQVNYCNVYGTSTLSQYDGTIGVIETYGFSIAKMYATHAPTLYLYENSQIHLYNGELAISALIYDNAELHIYGYGLDYDPLATPNWVAGYWDNNHSQEFKVYLRNVYTYNPNQVFLHELPEPTSIVIFGLSALFMSRRHRT
jgi:hypothetical protein